MLPRNLLLLGSCTRLRPSQLPVAESSPAATVPEVLCPPPPTFFSCYHLGRAAQSEAHVAKGG